MGRIPRRTIVATGETYHVIARGSGRMKIFRDSEDYELYLQLLAKGLEKYGISLLHYVLMPNHFHLILRPEVTDLSACMHIVQLTYAKRFCSKYKRVGRVWQERFKCFLIDTDAYLFACGNYIEMNPVRSKLAERPQGWKFSSYRHYAFGKKDRLVTTDPLYPSLGATNKKRRREYRKYPTMTRAEFNLSVPKN